MGTLLPSLMAATLREGITDYLATTFALTDPDVQRALSDFIADPDNGMFKGPYVRLRLPFAPASEGWRDSLDWVPEDFTPYGHQAAAFARLSTKDQVRPQPTMVTTGTGSGKTEAFLYPIVDHVLRARAAGVAGMKALILYPMNALANDQAGRIAQLIVNDSRLSGVTAGIYTGEQTSRRTTVSEHGLVSDRSMMQESPPDILLTNYKMLDQLLLRPVDAEIWRKSVDSLQYVVLDEFHTYDGAQGTDVAMLLRRLGLTLKAHWTDTTPVSAEDRTRPLGKITPVATSATLGSRAAPTAMLDFAHTVFGEQFSTDAVIGETRLTVDEWLGLGRPNDPRLRPIEPVVIDAVDRIDTAITAVPSDDDLGVAVTRAVLGELAVAIDPKGDTVDLPAVDMSRLARGQGLVDLVRRHPLLQRVIRAAADAISLEDLAVRVFPSLTEESPAEVRRAHRRIIEQLLAMLSHLRAVAGREAVGVDVHLWFRELSRINRVVAAAPQYLWNDDTDTTDSNLNLPSLYCRLCGRSGWGARLAPGFNNRLDVTDEAIRGDHAGGNRHFRALIHAPAEAAVTPRVEGLRWFHPEHRDLRTEPPASDSLEALEDRAVPVLMLTGPDAEDESVNDVCPSCGGAEGIRFLGSAIATQLSVTLSNLFGDDHLDLAEKKALMFTDSVQDAAHRAGFVQARSHVLSLRSALRGVMGPDPIDLTQLTEAAVTATGKDPIRRYELLAPDVADRDEFAPFWSPTSQQSARRAATVKVKRRLQFDIDLEFGLQSRTGRTMELTGSAIAEVYLGKPGRAAAIGARAVDNAEGTQPKLPGGERSADPLTEPCRLAAWVRGTVERMRTQGGIEHEWLRRYISGNANRYHIWGGRPRGQGMPAFPKGRPAPAFPAVGGGRTLPEGYDSVTSTASWYARWASRCLDVSRNEGAFLAKSLFRVLADQQILTTILNGSGATVYALPPQTIQVGTVGLEALQHRRHLLACDVCRTQVPGSATTIDELDGAPCLLVRCTGYLGRAAREENFYRRLYNSSRMRRVVAREHTSLLTAKERLAYEDGFKSSSTDPQAPNVLVATPTLEMGIDIGDLSTVMLGSLPRSVSSYLQRVGRAGRKTGNSLVLAYVRGRGEHLPKLYDPLSVIQGEVRPPATFLNAEEILQRQYVAHIADRFARDSGRSAPRDVRDALGSLDAGRWLGDLSIDSVHHATAYLDEFLAQFGDLLSQSAVDGLRAWASPGADGSPSRLSLHLRQVVLHWTADLAELERRRATVDESLPELERRDASPAATDDDHRAYRTALGSRKLLGAQIAELTTDYWVSALERYGVLPNYTLLDDSVTLDVGVTWIDPDTSNFVSDAVSYTRGSRTALTELAPGNTFYAQGLAVRIDAVDLGSGEANIVQMQACAQCGWLGSAAHGSPAVSACPRCLNTAVADVSQRLQIVDLKKVSAEVRRDEALISDLRDDRHSEAYTVVVAADLDPAHLGRSWFVTDLDIGAEYLRRLDIRWLNLGRRNSQGHQRTIAGREIATGLFRVCSSCGQLDTEAGANNLNEHRSWCRLRRAATEDVRDIALTRTLSTQGVLVHLPGRLEHDPFAHPSLSAAVLLGLRQVIGGSPEHLDVTVIGDALRAPDQRALLLHDTVPGGTGYLAEFADPAKVWSALVAAWATVRDCPCKDEERLACHRCLLPFARVWELDVVSRQSAFNALSDILGVTGTDGPAYEYWTASLTDQPPPPPPPTDESFLEGAFYTAFINRLRDQGATVLEHPGTYGTTAVITIQGATPRRWTLRPQVPLGYVQPDFVLSTPSLPEIAIFADGKRFHASVEHNRIADDAEKRAQLRDGGYVVWSFSNEDLSYFRDRVEHPPPWFTSQGANVVRSTFQVRPAVLAQLDRDPISQLLTLVLSPDLDDRRRLGRVLPYLFLTGRPTQRCAIPALGEATLRMLDGETVLDQPDGARSWSYTSGRLALVAATASSNEPAGVLAIDDRPETLDSEGGAGWRDWLRIGNWLGLAGNHRIVTRSQLVSGAVTVTAHPTLVLAPAWQNLLGQAITDQEQALIRSLAHQQSIPLPELGVETDDGLVIDLAWPDQRIAVLFDDAATTPEGWTRVTADAGDLATALQQGDS